nr:MAG TPA_asm: hypothetical protein [Bacteriophage sp.]
MKNTPPPCIAGLFIFSPEGFFQNQFIFSYSVQRDSWTLHLCTPRVNK